MSQPSPSKKPSMAPRSSAPSDSTDIRGSMAKQAQTGFEPTISWRATQARHAVAQGHILPNHPVISRRPLGPSATEPVLSFSNSGPSSSFNSHSNHSPTRFPPFQTNKEIMNLVYTDGKRPNELRPFGETGSNARDGPGSRTNSLVGGGGPGLFGQGPTTTTTTMQQDDDEQQDGDGFDLDEVFGGGSSSNRFVIPPFGGGGGASSSFQGDSQDSTRTITQRVKRAFEGEDSATTLVDEGGRDMDEEMIATDVEDEGAEEAEEESRQVVSNLPERKFAGPRRAFKKTQSLPASAFMADF